MLIIGLDHHPSTQQIAFLDLETGEIGEQQLSHKGGEVEQFYRGLKQQRISVRVGMEATGNMSWFERLMMELDFELWIRDPLQIRRQREPKAEDTAEMHSCSSAFPSFEADKDPLHEISFHTELTVESQSKILYWSEGATSVKMSGLA